MGLVEKTPLTVPTLQSMEGGLLGITDGNELGLKDGVSDGITNGKLGEKVVD